MHPHHLLNKYEELDISGHLVIEFRNIYRVHLEFLKEHIKDNSSRVRLLPPYRKHLA
jgi:hypothetical protein